MKRYLCLAVAVLFVLQAAGCASSSAPQETEQPQQAQEVQETQEIQNTQEQEACVFTDDLGREVSVTKAERVAVMIGSFADVWCLAGGRDKIVATADDSWTSFDLGLNEDVLNLGAIKTPSLETLLSAEPDLVIGSCNTSSNLDLQEILEQAGIAVAYFDVQCFDDYLHMLKICTDITGCTENYEKYGTEVAALVDAAVSRQDGSAPRILCMRATGSSCTVKKSTDNLLGEMLADLGCINVADQGDAALEDLSLEAIMMADPDYIFCVLQGSDPTAATETLEQTLLSNPAWGSLRAVQNGCFYTLEHSLFNLKPNARWGEAYEKLADILYPESA